MAGRRRAKEVIIFVIRNDDGDDDSIQQCCDSRIMSCQLIGAGRRAWMEKTYKKKAPLKLGRWPNLGLDQYR